MADVICKCLPYTAATPSNATASFFIDRYVETEISLLELCRSLQRDQHHLMEAVLPVLGI